MGREAASSHGQEIRGGRVDPQGRRDWRARRCKNFINEYITARSDIKPRSVNRLEAAGKKLVECFGPDRRMKEFTVGDADSFRVWLLGQGFAENTVRRLCGRAKQFFKAAVRRKLIPENPFGDLVSAVRGNPSRFYFVTQEEATKVLDACPDAEWRLLFALSRYGGLRCPSEHLSLRWGDVDWANNRVRVPSPKTEHIEGKESRMIPMFPELKPYLEEAFEQAAPGTEFVINRYRSCNANLRTQLMRIIKRAGLKPWAKPFQNLRSTRETELMEKFPAHVVCGWIGNSEAIALKHYLQVTDDHFERAVRGEAEIGPEVAPTVTNTGSAKSGAACARRGEQRAAGGSDHQRKSPGIAGACDFLRYSEHLFSTPTGSRTPVFGLRIRRPGPLDDGGLWRPRADWFGEIPAATISWLSAARRPKLSWYLKARSLSTRGSPLLRLGSLATVSWSLVAAAVWMVPGRPAVGHCGTNLARSETSESPPAAGGRSARADQGPHFAVEGVALGP